MALQIRRAMPADAERLSALAMATYIETFGDSYPPQDLHDFLDAHYSPAPQRRELEDPLSAAWLLFDGEQAIGYLAAGPNSLAHALAAEGDIELKRLYVHATHQGGGHGAQLMDAFPDWLTSPGAARCGWACGRKTSARSASTRATAVCRLAAMNSRWAKAATEFILRRP